MSSNDGKKVGFVSLGCPKNLVDSEVMMGMLQRDGYTITADAHDADVLVVNTCSFIESAQRESVDTILELAEFKKQGKARRVIVAGCMVERFREEIAREIPEVDAMVGTNELARISSACSGQAATLPILPGDFFDPTPTAPYLYDDLTPRLLSTPRHSVYIKIAEGCDHPCTFCIIPQFRGKFRSRRFESVAAEAGRLARQGAREIVLVGQDSTCYGDDLGLKNGLATLLDRLALTAREANQEGADLRWIRTLYFYPNRVNQPLLDAVARHPELCKYVDMPLQHASAAVLKRMKRGAHGDIFLKLIEKIRRTVPGAALRTSFIVGFPGETEQDFAELCDFVRAARFDWLGVFGYSDEATNQASRLDAKVPAEVIERRKRELMRLQRGISKKLRKQAIGGRFPVLVEGPSEETDLLWQGRLEGQAPEIDGKVLINDVAEGITPTAGEFATVEITAAQDYDLVGRLV